MHNFTSLIRNESIQKDPDPSLKKTHLCFNLFIKNLTSYQVTVYVLCDQRIKEEQSSLGKVN